MSNTTRTGLLAFGAVGGIGLIAVVVILTTVANVKREASGLSDPARGRDSSARQPVRSELTDWQRTEWDKLRLQNSERSFVLFGHVENAWHIYGVIGNGTGWTHTDRTIKYKSVDAATKAAGGACAEPNVKAIAVVDLFSREDPTILRWVSRDGRRPIISDGAPSTALNDSLTQTLFVAQLQIGEGIR
jgi:hypothetical protein